MTALIEALAKLVEALKPWRWFLFALVVLAFAAFGPPIRDRTLLEWSGQIIKTVLGGGG